MTIKSLKAALLIGVNAVVVSILAITAWTSYRNTLHELDELFDAELAQTARLIKSLTHDNEFLHPDQQLTIIELPKFIDESLLANDGDGYRTLDGHKYETKLGFQVWRDSQLVLASENALGEQLAPFTPGYHEHFREQQIWISFSHYDSKTGLWIFTAQRADIRSELSGYLARDQLLALVLTWLPISLGILWLTNRVLQPVRRYAQTLGDRRADQLQPIIAPLPAEIEPIRLAVNSLLARISEQLERERRFINDAAHELRTPLAALKLHAAQLPDRHHPSAKAVGKVSERMNHLVEQLLILAKADSPQASLGTMLAFNIAELVEQIISELPIEAIEVVDWNIRIPRQLTGHGYPTLLGVALRNVIENAIKYSGEKPLISISAENLDNRIHIEIADHGPGVDDTQIRHLTERFYRAEQHRQVANGAGLGLSISARVAQLHGSELIFAPNQPHGLRAILSIPANTSSNSP